MRKTRLAGLAALALAVAAAVGTPVGLWQARQEPSPSPPMAPPVEFTEPHLDNIPLNLGEASIIPPDWLETP